MKKKKDWKKVLAFSLIELMISLITISVITAAFTPVISKKLQSSEIVIGKESKISNDCSYIDEDCELCDLNSDTCSLCTKECNANQTANKDTCKCTNCNDGDIGVQNCTVSCKWDSKNSKIKCTQCSNGYYVGNNGECIECPVGHKCSNGKDKDPCEGGDPGQYQDEEGQTECKACATGATSTEGSAACTCPTNCRNDACDALTGACTACTNSTYLRPDTKKCVPANQCPSGYYGDSASGTCKQCEANYYCQNGIRYQCSTNAQATPAGQTKCTPAANCADADDNGDCTICNDKYYGTGACTLCTAGHYCTGGRQHACAKGHHMNSTGATACTACAKGHHMNSTGATTCTACAKGHHVNSTGAHTCSACAKGHHVNSTGAHTCSACAAGTHMNSTGAHTCSACSSGYYVTTTGAHTCGSTCSSRHSHCTGCNASSACCTGCSSGFHTHGCGCRRSCTWQWVTNGESCDRCRESTCSWWTAGCCHSWSTSWHSCNCRTNWAHVCR